MLFFTGTHQWNSVGLLLSSDWLPGVAVVLLDCHRRITVSSPPRLTEDLAATLTLYDVSACRKTAAAVPVVQSKGNLLLLLIHFLLPLRDEANNALHATHS